MSVDRLGGHDDPAHVAGTRQRADALAEVVGIGEEERRVEAVQHESRDVAGVGIALGVVVALEVVDPAEHRIVRAPGPADEVQQRESDRDPDAPEHAENGDAGERHHRQRELRASPVAQAPRAHDVDQAQDRDDHDGRERRLRQVVHETGSKHQEQRQDAGADEPGDLAASADVLGDGGARAARGDREPLEEPGRDVRDAEDRELLVLVDLLAKPARVAARQDARVGERDEGDPDRRGEQRLEILERHIGHAETRQAGGDVADDGHLIGETQHRDHCRRADDRDEDTRHLRRDPTQAEDQRERRDADRERGRVGLVESRDEVAHSPQQALRVDREPEKLGSCATMTVTAMPIR